MSDPYREALAQWREARIAALTAEYGWLNLVGLWWLDHGAVTIGSAPDCDAVLPRGPARLGTARLTKDTFTFEPSDGGEPTVIVVPKKGPVRFHAGGFLMEAVRLAGQTALRIRDPEASARTAFAGIETFEDDPSWRIVADWVPLDRPIAMAVDNITGDPSDVTVTHIAVFTHEGRRIELLPTHGTAEQPQFVLLDGTSGKETYAASRFLFGEAISGGTIVLDFNKAINPPCAFSDFAVCPLPPPQNVLPFRVEAGEKIWQAPPGR